MSEDESAGSNIIDYIDFTHLEEPINNAAYVEALLDHVPELPPNIVEIPMFEDIIPLNSAIPEGWNEWSVNVTVHRECEGVIWNGDNWVPIYKEYFCVRYVRIV